MTSAMAHCCISSRFINISNYSHGRIQEVLGRHSFIIYFHYCFAGLVFRQLSLAFVHLLPVPSLAPTGFDFGVLLAGLIGFLRPEGYSIDQIFLLGWAELSWYLAPRNRLTLLHVLRTPNSVCSHLSQMWYMISLNNPQNQTIEKKQRSTNRKR